MGVIAEIQGDLEKGAMRLIAEYKARLLADAVKLCGDLTEAEDLVSRTFIQAIDNIGSCRNDANLYCWMKAILTNFRRADMNRPVRRGTQPVDEAMLQLYAGSDGRTEEEILRNSDNDALREAIEQLDPEYKQAVALYYFNDLSLKDMALLLHSSTSSASRKLQIAKKILAAKLRDKLDRGKKPLALLAAALLAAGALFGVTKAVEWVRGGDDGGVVPQVLRQTEKTEKANMKASQVCSMALALAAGAAEAAGPQTLTVGTDTVLIYDEPGEYALHLPSSVSARLLVVGGGGAGGTTVGGGGGGGAVVAAEEMLPAGDYVVTVGTGGQLRCTAPYDNVDSKAWYAGGNGTASSFVGQGLSLTADGGGGGGGWQDYNPSEQRGQAGANGGGGCHNQGGGVSTGDGFGGGASLSNAAGGGGGAGGPAENGGGVASGQGGAGVFSDITGVRLDYGAGGGGGGAGGGIARAPGAAGGAGAGAGAVQNSGCGGNGVDGRGGGGGGGGFTPGTAGGTGGCGCVIVRYFALADNALSVSATPAEYGTPNPGYGIVTFDDAETHELVQPIDTIEVSPGVRIVLKGWTLEAFDAQTGKMELVRQYPGSLAAGDSASKCVYRQEGAACLTWQWEVQYLVRATAGAGGAVSPAEQWVAEGGSAVVEASTGSELIFCAWTGDRTGTDNPMCFADVRAPFAVTATYCPVFHVSTDGSDEAEGTAEAPFGTVAHALEVASALARETSSAAGVKIGPGRFLLDDTLSVADDIRLVGSGRDVTILDGQAKCRVMSVDCATAVVSGLTMTNAASSSGYGCGLQILANGGTVADCRVTGCKTATHNLRGGGVCLDSSAARLLRTVVDNNSIRYQGQPQELGGGIYVVNGLIENCLVVNNTAYAGGGIDIGYMGDPVIRNCTVADNTAATLGGGIYAEQRSAKGTVVNCLFADNVAGTDATAGKPEWNTDVNVHATVFRNCAFKGVSAVPSDSCIVVPSPFAPGGYEPLLSSAVVNAGVDDGELPGSDIRGTPRVKGSAPDIGCYEADITSFACSGSCDHEVAFAGEPLAFSLKLFGVDPADVDVRWTFTGADGAVIGTGTGLTCSGSFSTYGDLAYSVVASNRTTHAVSTDSRASACFLAPMTNYVTAAANPSSAWPYATPETAATNVLDAVGAAIAGAVVKLAPGEHRVLRRLEVAKGISIVGEGHETTTIRRAGDEKFGVVLLNDEAAELRGVTVTGGIGTDAGFGVKIGARGGAVVGCRIAGNAAGTYNQRGGGVSLESPAARLIRSIVVANTNLYGGTGNASDYGGGVTAQAGLVENCLIVSNAALRGGGICVEGAAQVRNCTFAGNKARVEGGGVYVNTTAAGTSVVNCLFADDEADNDGGDGKPEWAAAKDEAKPFFSHCAFKGVSAAPDESSLVVAHPFVSDGFALQLSSPAVNGGCPYEGLSDVDLAGAPRVSGDGVDIGCYEADLSQLVCSPGCARPQAFAGETLTFAASVFGADEKDVSAVWTFTDAEGNVLAEREGLSFEASFQCYGELTAEVVATDTSDGRTARESRVVCLLGARTNYVASVRPDASAWPYATPETAAGSVAEAAAAAMDRGVVKLLPGVHLTDAELLVDKAVSFVGDGWDKTEIRRNPSATANFRLVRLNNEQASFTGLTLSGGCSTGNGAGVQIAAGGGRLVRCRVCDSRAAGYYVKGGGVSLESSKAVVSHCLVDNNDERYLEQYVNECGGGIYAVAGLVENCLVISNFARQGGGIAVDGAVTVRNCTFVRNVAAGPEGFEQSAATGGGLCLVSAGATFVNCLFADNADSGVSEYAGAPEWTGTAAATWSHCAWTPETPQSATIGADSIYVDPLFKNPARLNFRLQRTSPLVNAGLPSAEVKADATDFYGNPRVINRVPDIGCSECLQNGFMLLVK